MSDEEIDLRESERLDTIDLYEGEIEWIKSLSEDDDFIEQDYKVEQPKALIKKLKKEIEIIKEDKNFNYVKYWKRLNRITEPHYIELIPIGDV
jgi:hypothetical protein